MPRCISMLRLPLDTALFNCTMDEDQFVEVCTDLQTGDVNGSGTPSDTLQSIAEARALPVSLELPDLTMQAGELLDIQATIPSGIYVWRVIAGSVSKSGKLVRL
jgi:hypothetical protein